MRILTNIDAILFDADGTLIDTYQMILESMRYTVSRELGLDLSDSELMQGVGTPLFDQFMVFCKGDDTQAEHMVSVYRPHMAQTHDEKISAFTDTREALRELSQKGYQMAVVTSKPHELAKRGLTRTHLIPYLDFIIGADDFPEHKPLPGPILEGCKRLNVLPQNTVYVGDSPYDIAAGRAAECKTIGALWGMFTKSQLLAENPTTCATSLGEIARAMPKL